MADAEPIKRKATPGVPSTHKPAAPTGDPEWVTTSAFDDKTRDALKKAHGS